MTRTRTLLVKIDKPPGGRSRLSYSEPIGICYIAAVLRQHELDCQLCHLFAESAEEQLRRVLEEYQPDIVGFSVRNFSLGWSQTCLDMVRREFPNIRIAVGGECVTAELFTHLGELLDADIFMIGDGETSFLQYASSAEPSTIPGVAFKAPDGRYRLSGAPTHCVHPSRLPMMLRDGLPMEQYSAEAFQGKRYATMHTQRGCRYRCTFCHTASRYAEPQSRTVPQIFAELDHLISEYRMEAVAIWDEDFFADPRRVRAIAQGLVDRGSPVEWHSYMKLTDLRKPEIQAMLPLLRDSGYIRAIIGLESFVAMTLRSYHKTNDGSAEEFCKQLTENNILLCPTYIIGAPHESALDVRCGLDRLRRLYYDHGIRMDLPYVSFITPFPGTELYDEYSRKGLIFDTDWSHYDGEHVIVRSRCHPEELLGLRDEFYGHFYGQQAIARRG
jgi:anaerobic magnesium-protoporphyrin IX monomethyl ester cyclase